MTEEDGKENTVHYKTSKMKRLKGPTGIHNNQQSLKQFIYIYIHIHIRRGNKHLFGTKKTGTMVWNFFN